MRAWRTVVETPEFVRTARSCMTDAEREAFINYIAQYPDSGDILRGTGGVRKVRWAVGSKGKRGGVRVVYYYRPDAMPVFLLSAYAKSAKADLTQAERNALRSIIAALIHSYGK
jgi:hypothetical protein